MRRLLYLVLCLSGCLLIVLLLRTRRVTRQQMAAARGPEEHERVPVRESRAQVIPLGHRPTPAAGPVAEPTVQTPHQRVATAGSMKLAHSTNAESDVEEETARRRQMAEIRAEMADVISHGVLFSMAHERGVSGGLVVASGWDLLDAILRVEGLRAEDGSATPEDARRLDHLLLEARRRDAEARAAARELEAERTIQTGQRSERRRQYR